MSKRKRSESLGATIAAALGGLGAACVGGVLVRMGVRLVVAAASVGGVGALGAVALDGRARDAALGASAVGAGQLVLAWLEADARIAASERKRNAALVGVADVVEVDDERDPVEHDAVRDQPDDDGLVIELAMPRNGAPESLWDRLRSPASSPWLGVAMAALPLLLLAWL